MSEKLYGLLLRLYPARFRKEYGEEAMRVLRERLRDERGPMARLRLWFDLVADAGLSLSREYRRAAVGLLHRASGCRFQDSQPGFGSLRGGLLSRPAARLNLMDIRLRW